MATDPDTDPAGVTADPDTDPAAATRDTEQRPAFGPSGYLPPKASARARKIVLRAPLGLQWVVGALVAGVVVVVAGVAFLASSGPPEAPWVATVEVQAVDGDARLGDLDVLLVTAGGPAVAFADLTEFDLGWCPDSRRVEGEVDGAGASWHAATGRGDGVSSLDRHPVVVHDGVAYVDPTRRVAGPRPADERRTPACR